MNKLLNISSVLLAVMALFLSTTVHARVCALKSSSGTCLFWSGSVEAQLTASNVDVSQNNYQLGMIITPQKGTSGPTGQPRARLLCSDPTIITLPDSFPPILDSVELSNSVVSEYSKFKTASELIKLNTYTNGNKDIQQTFITSPLDTTLLQYPQNYSALEIKCPGDTKPIDYVSCKMQVTVQLKVKGNNKWRVKSEATFACTLPNCDTLSYDPIAKKFDRRQYSCVEKNDDDDDDDDDHDDDDDDHDEDHD
ncbi:hypothetical protein [Methylocucumis oryzae]|nr:hypothetical protein [Methylocucumis oryzae]